MAESIHVGGEPGGLHDRPLLADNVSILSSSLLASLSTSLIASGSNQITSPSTESSDTSNSLIVPPSYSSSLSVIGIFIIVK